jgi:hypothetical protein
MIVANDREVAVGILTEHHARGAAFEDLGGMPDRGRVDAAHHRHRGKHRGIARPACDDDLRAVFERFDERLDACHADDVRTAVDHIRIELRRIRERRNLAFPQLALEIALVLFAMYRRKLEGQLLFASDLACNADQPRKLRVAARRARGSDDHRDFRRAAGKKHQSEIALVGGIGKERVAGAEVVRSGVCRPGIGADEMRLQSHRALQRLLPKAGAQYPGCREYADLVHRGAPITSC